MAHTRKENILMSKKQLLIIFTRNPELGKVKTRLAAGVGQNAALEIYKFLLNHTVQITKPLTVDKEVHYSVAVRENDIWNAEIYNKVQQEGEDLGIRMLKAFRDGFEKGYTQIVIIGSDMFDIATEDIEKAFSELEQNKYVIGPASDGGYYLLGMSQLSEDLFRNKEWGTSTVLRDTLKNVTLDDVSMLAERNDIDVADDIKDNAVFLPFLKVIEE